MYAQREGGTGLVPAVHCDTRAGVTPMDRAKAVGPPAADAARLIAWMLFMPETLALLKLRRKDSIDRFFQSKDCKTLKQTLAI